MTEAELLFAVRVLEVPLGASPEYPACHPVAQARAEISLRYHGLTHDIGREEASRRARADWLGRFLEAEAAAEIERQLREGAKG